MLELLAKCIWGWGDLLKATEFAKRQVEFADLSGGWSINQTSVQHLAMRSSIWDYDGIRAMVSVGRSNQAHQQPEVQFYVLSPGTNSVTFF